MHRPHLRRDVVVNYRMMHGKTSPIRHDGSGVFADIPSPFTATRYHFAVRRESIPDCLEITDETEEGEIMGLRHKDLQVSGVQFHPESILTEHVRTLMRNFLNPKLRDRGPHRSCHRRRFRYGRASAPLAEAGLSNLDGKDSSQAAGDP